MQSTSPVFPQPPVQPWYRHRWPWFIMLGPAAVMLATAVTVGLALRQPDAVVVDDYYKQGKAINQDLRRDRVATGMRMAFHGRYDAATGVLAGRLQSFGRPMRMPFRIMLAHPTQPAKDLVLEAQPGADGSVALAVPGLEMTHWQVVIEGAGREWRLARGWSPASATGLEIVADAPL
ncbi:FixH family protein [Massilia sp. GCM10023247]|uniref:FixH family protein n=1 Tax=Massilia sp. GCM10023247 TaxID=3252643 RepID=UPI0036092F1A